MRRPRSTRWWTRLTVALLGTWLVLVLGEPGVVHVCPTHGGSPAHAGAMAMADHGGHHSAPAHDHQACTCIGCCVGAGGVALIDRVPTTAFAVALTPVAAERTPVGLLPRPGPRYSRPYTTGPPRA